VIHLWLLIALMFVLSGCGSTSWKGGSQNKVVASTEELPRSKSGNPPFYEVYGVRYTVMNSSIGYKERGVASWYGKKFHGRKTSNQEDYNMYAMTAAHKSLPLPSYVRVRNLRNNKSIVVRVNDRGPFVDNRIIDLSYAGAMKLDMVGTGTSLVEVTAITFDDPPGDRPTKQTTTPKPVPDRTSGPQPATTIAPWAALLRGGGAWDWLV